MRATEHERDESRPGCGGGFVMAPAERVNGYRAGRREAVERRVWSADTIGRARDTAAGWRRAESDHAETSFYGAATVQYWRAYWLGVAREARA